MVLDVEPHLAADRLRDMTMDQLVVRRRVAAHQLHRIPVFLSRLAREIEPCEMRELLRQRGVNAAGDAAVMLRDLRARAAAARVAEQREIVAAREREAIAEDREPTEPDEMIATAA